jgi:hypothetical protein
MRDMLESVMNALKGTGSPSKENVEVEGDKKVIRLFLMTH